MIQALFVVVQDCRLLSTFILGLHSFHALLTPYVCTQTIHALWHFNEQSPSPVIGAHREGHRLRLDRRGAHIANNAIPPSGGGKVGLANTLTAGGAPSTSGRRSIGGGDALLEWPDVPKSASRRGLGSGPPPVDPAKSMGTRLDLANPTSDEVSRLNGSPFLKSSFLVVLFYLFHLCVGLLRCTAPTTSCSTTSL
jgi:hypothetical protein